MAKKIVSKLKSAVKKGKAPGADKAPDVIPPKLSQKESSGDEGLLPESTPTTDAPSGDYLRQYQYKREMPLGHPNSDPQSGGKAAKMKEILLSQKKVTILIPLDAGSDPKVPYSVTLNGYRLDLPVNTYVEVPEQVANVVMDSQIQTVAALNQFKAGEDADALK